VLRLISGQLKFLSDILLIFSEIIRRRATKVSGGGGTPTALRLVA